MDRRDFLASISAAAGASLLPACARTDEVAIPPGEFVGPSLVLGHRLRTGDFPAPTETRKLPALIVGGGVGGLSAGWKLERAGFHDFLLLELENEPGGNARGGRNAVSAYPLGAHYLPLPGPESVATRELLSELGVLQGDPRALRPRYHERFLCAAPQERLYRNGLWQEGLLPQTGVSAAEKAQYTRFQQLMSDYRQKRDAAGRRAFALPMALSSQAPEFLALDRVSMRDWLLAQGIDSPHLHWYVDYACRDDYGTTSAEVSAWAGIHYFAGRDGEAENAEGDNVLTAPDGNAWLTRGLASRLGGRVMSGALVYRITDTGRHVEADVFLAAEGRSLRLQADQLIWAAPVFLLPTVLAGRDDLKAAARHYSYAPWLVANLSLSAMPGERAGAGIAWDNVLYDSPGLGYVVATHQQMRLRPGATVLTYYRALSGMSPAQGRELLQNSSRAKLAGKILDELSRPHPNIRALTTNLDIVRYGHAMARPTTGFLWSGAREPFATDGQRLRFAHADVSGFSIFEEAQYRGVLAAERTLRRLGHRFTTSLA